MSVVRLHFNGLNVIAVVLPVPQVYFFLFHLSCSLCFKLQISTAASDRQPYMLNGRMHKRSGHLTENSFGIANGQISG